jgi:fucose 4-O-acetylase-like acetyltransferase
MTGHADFWMLSNHAFVLGVFAAAGEKRFSRLYTKRNKLLVMLAGLAGAAAAFVVMQRMGGSGRAESYVAELVMNVFITLAVLGAAYLLPDKKITVLAMIGEASLFIYILHTTMFYAIIFKLESLGYAWGTAITAFITMLCAVILFRLYSLFSGPVLKDTRKKYEKIRSAQIQLHNTDNDAAA